MPSPAAKSLLEFKDYFKLIDIWRVIHPNEKRFTWRGHTKKGFVSSRIDYWLISSHLIYDMVKTEIYPSIKTDHSLVQISFALREIQQRGRGFWKFNCSLLKDKEYVDKINEYLNLCSEKYCRLKNKSLVWDAIKCDIRGMTISYASYKSKQKRLYLDELKKELECLEKCLDNNEDVHERYVSAKK